MQKPNYKDMIKDTIASNYNVRNDLKSKTVPEIQKIAQSDRLPYSVAVINVMGDLNIGTIIRSSHCMGAENVYVFGRSAYDGRSLVGVDNYQNIIKVPMLNDDGLTVNAEKFKAFFDEKGMTPVMVEQGGTPLHREKWEYENICLVMGCEGTGIQDDILSLYNNRISIPQLGVLRSLNVAGAANMVMWDLVSKKFPDYLDKVS